VTEAWSALSADYSHDELDAVADAFGVTSRGSARLQSQPDDPLLRASLATALRGLVARRALTLGGTAASPRIELLEPHGTLLGTFIGATRVLSAEAEERSRTERWVVFLREDVAVQQCAVAGTAIVRMTALAPSAAIASLLDSLRLPQSDAERDLTRRPLEASAAAFDRGSDALRAAGATDALIDLVHARRRRITIVEEQIDGRRMERRTRRWIDAGTLGWWRVEPDDYDPPTVVRLIPCEADEPKNVLALEGAPSP
jgi:hypothetical protein